MPQKDIELGEPWPASASAGLSVTAAATVWLGYHGHMRSWFPVVLVACQSPAENIESDPFCPRELAPSVDTQAVLHDTSDSGWMDTGDSGTSPDPSNLPPEAGFAFQQVLGGLEFPVDLISVGDGTLLIAGKLGELSRVDLETHTILGSARADELWPLSTHVEEGFLSIALHPDFGNGIDDHLFSWQTTEYQTTNSIVRWDLQLEPFAVSNPVEVLAVDKYIQGIATHNGGKLVWWQGESDEPVLYVSVGNGGGQENIQAGQMGDVMTASILALKVDEEGVAQPAIETPYENEFVVAKGLRNPWRMIDCGDVLCVGDVGKEDFEEFNLYTGAGANFGHGRFEGPSDGTYDDPVLWYAHGSDEFTSEDPDHTDARGESIMMGVHVSGQAYEGLLEDFVLYADLYQGWIRGYYLGDDETMQGVDLHLAHQAVLGAMVEVEDGTVYAVEMFGTLRKLVPLAEVPTVGMAGDPISETAFGDGGIDYTVRFPLWSNGTSKQRFIQLPDGTQIDTSDSENWVFPIGTRSYKTFLWNGQPVETRVLEKTDTGWAPGVYLWEADGSEAYLTDGTDQEPLVEMDTPYTVPSTGACQMCHGNAQDSLLGLEPFQLGSRGVDIFEGHISDEVEIPTVSDTEVGLEARGYLHGNCSTCHQGASVTGVELDLRYSTDPYGMTGEGIYEYSGIPFIDPGNPPNSAIFKAIAEEVMPPLTLSVKDQEAIQLLGEWISAMEVEKKDSQKDSEDE